MSPYFGKTLLTFFPYFFHRMGLLLSGRLSLSELATDEVQVFVLCLVATASALVGTLLVLRKMTMLANSLSHTILLGIVSAYLLFNVKGGLQMDLKILLIAALVSGLLTTLCTQFFNQVLKLQEDASIGLVFTALFALGIVLITLYLRNAHVGIEVVMGNADALHPDDLRTSSVVALANFIFLTLFFKQWRLVSFDPIFAKCVGARSSLFHYLLMFLTSATAIGAFRAVGVLLFLAFLVGPPLIARMLTHDLKKMLLLACLVGMLASLLGVALARHFLSVYQLPLSTAGLVVTLIGGFFVLAIIGKKMHNKIDEKNQSPRKYRIDWAKRS